MKKGLKKSENFSKKNGTLSDLEFFRRCNSTQKSKSYQQFKCV